MYYTDQCLLERTVAARTDSNGVNRQWQSSVTDSERQNLLQFNPFILQFSLYLLQSNTQFTTNFTLA